MNKEEFLFLDDLSEHANLPRVLKNTPNLFQRELSNPKDKDIFMLHGHQVDLLNGTFWRLARFLVRHVWKNLERFGIRDLTRAAKNYAVLKSFLKK